MKFYNIIVSALTLLCVSGAAEAKQFVFDCATGAQRESVSENGAVVWSGERESRLSEPLSCGDTILFKVPDGLELTLGLRKVRESRSGMIFMADRGDGGMMSSVLMQRKDSIEAQIQDLRDGRSWTISISADGYRVRLNEEPCSGGGDDAVHLPEDAKVQLKPKLAMASVAAVVGSKYVDVLIVADLGAAAFCAKQGWHLSDAAEMAVEKMNMAIANTGIDSTFTFRLKGVRILPWKIGNDVTSEVLYAAATGKTVNGVDLQIVKNWQDETGADLVSVWIDAYDANYRSGVVGLGYEYNPSSAGVYGYSLCDAYSSITRHTMTHECGHNLGAGHSDVQSSYPGPQYYDYSAGYYFSANGIRYCTIMAYEGEGPGGSCVPYFSSPDHQYQGVTVGDAKHDNTRTLRNTWSTVAAYRNGGDVDPEDCIVRGVTFSPLPGTVDPGSAFHMVPTESDGVVHYTLDGTLPTLSSPVWTGQSPTLTRSTLVRAISVVDVVMGDVCEAQYVVANDLGKGLDNSNLSWRADPDGSWLFCSDVTSDGIDAVKCASVANSDSSPTLETCAVGPGTLTFFYSTTMRSESRAFQVLCDGAILFEDSNGTYPKNNTTADWRIGSVNVPAGIHALQFVCKKIGSGSWGLGYNGVRLDDVKWSGTTPVTVTFDAAGGQGGCMKGLIAGDSLTEFPTVTREGYDFAGWVDLSTGEVDVQPPLVMSTNRTLTANWRAHNYRIVYDANGGEGTVEGQDCLYDGYVTLRENGFIKEDCAFDGWSRSNDNCSDFKAGAQVSNLTAENGGTVRLYAAWRKLVPYRKVVFDAGEGTVSESERTVVKDNAVGSLPTPTLSKYKFDGWFTATTGGTKVTAKTKVTANITYYAHWTYDGSATVSVQVAEGCSGNGTVSGGKKAKAGMKLTLKATAAKGHVFAGWYQDAQCAEPMEGDVDYRTASFSYVVGKEDVTLYAKFLPIADDFITVDVADSVEIVTKQLIDPIQVNYESASKTTLKMSGLPKGLSFTTKLVVTKKTDKKTKVTTVTTNALPNQIYGTPAKSGLYTATLTATTAGKKTAVTNIAFNVLNREAGERILRVDYDKTMGKAAGTGVRVAGKTATLTATPRAAKKATKKTPAVPGTVFAGWYTDASCSSPLPGTSDFRSKVFGYTMPDEDTSVYARFVDPTDDQDIALNIDGENITTNATDVTFYVNDKLPLDFSIDSASLPTVTMSGLPSGLKCTQKLVVTKTTKTVNKKKVTTVTTNALPNTIYGTPTKPGVYTVTAKLSNDTVSSKKPLVRKFTMVVDNFTAANDLIVVKDRDGNEATLANGRDEKYEVSVGVADIDLPVITRGDWAVEAKVSGLPDGLKYDAKTGKITGVATKAGTCTVYVTAVQAMVSPSGKVAKSNTVSTFTVVAKALPSWATGTFGGFIGREDAGDGVRMYGKVSFAVASNGKVSASVESVGQKYAFSATGFVSCQIDDDDEVYVFSMKTRAGQVLTGEIAKSRNDLATMLQDEEGDGAAEGTFVLSDEESFSIFLWRNEHGKDGRLAADATGNAKRVMDAIKAKKKIVLKNYDEAYGSCVLKIDAKGNTTLSGKTQSGVSLSGTGFLMLDDGCYHVTADQVIYDKKKRLIYRMTICWQPIFDDEGNIVDWDDECCDHSLQVYGAPWVK